MGNQVSEKTCIKIHMSENSLALIGDTPFGRYGSMPIRSLTAPVMRCLQPRYIKCAAAHLMYLGCTQRIASAVNDKIGIEPTR
jgi:hypothetical protein